MQKYDYYSHMIIIQIPRTSTPSKVAQLRHHLTPSKQDV